MSVDFITLFKEAIKEALHEFCEEHPRLFREGVFLSNQRVDATDSPRESIPSVEELADNFDGDGQPVAVKEEGQSKEVFVIPEGFVTFRELAILTSTPRSTFASRLYKNMCGFKSFCVKVVKIGWCAHKEKALAWLEEHAKK